MHNEESTRLVRLDDVLSLLPVSRSTWWKGVKEKRYPQPVKLGKRITCWRLDDIIALADHGVTNGEDDV